jgi:hypothetical protein
MGHVAISKGATGAEESARAACGDNAAPKTSEQHNPSQATLNMSRVPRRDANRAPSLFDSPRKTCSGLDAAPFATDSALPAGIDAARAKMFDAGVS